MKLSIQIVAIVVSSVFLCAAELDGPAVPSTGPGGWETGGGDLSALRFVKIGRALGEEMDKGGERCSALRGVIAPQEFRRSVASARVSSVNGTPANFPQTIQFNRRNWYNSSKEEQLADVFKGYSILALAKPVQIDGTVVRRCLPQAVQEKVFGHFDEWTVGSAPRFLKEFHEASTQLKKIIQAHSKELDSWMVPTPRLLEIITEAERADRLGGEGAFVLGASATSIRFKSGEMKDGRNSKIGRSLFMSLNESVWVRSSEAQRVELLFHECLGLADVDDSRYQFSSRLWKMVPARLYAML